MALSGPHATANGRSRPLKLLVHGSSQLVRSRSGGRVLAALLQHLSADLEPADPQLLQVHTTAVVRDGEALLLPAGLREHVKVLQPRFAKARTTIVDTPRVLVDLQSHELVVPEPTVPFDPAVIHELDTGVKLGNELPWVRPGRVPLRAWFMARPTDTAGALTTAVAVTTALPLVDASDLRAAINMLVELFETVTAFAFWYESADQLVERMQALLD